MKKFWLAFLCLSAIVLLFSFTKNSMSIEQRKYKLIAKDGRFELRFYPEAIQATTNLTSSNYNESANQGFRTLAGYIFGGNNENKKIAMTAPVEMSVGTSSTKMSFTMPSEHKISELPKPNDSKISIHTTPAEYTASVSFGGYASDEKIDKYKNELFEYLKSKKIKNIGNFRFLGYNSPFRIFGRKNEILVQIEYPNNSEKNESSHSR
ncbi:MAG: SOUL family heme-binding protein [Bacteroidota bacterium]